MHAGPGEWRSSSIFIEQALGGLGDIPVDERDSGRPRQHRRNLVTQARPDLHELLADAEELGAAV